MSVGIKAYLARLRVWNQAVAVRFNGRRSSRVSTSLPTVPRPLAPDMIQGVDRRVTGGTVDLVEYLFVDRLRLDSYVSQFASLTVYDKVPVWSISANLAGPAFDSRQERPARLREDHEKIELLISHLRNNDQLSEARLQDYRTDRRLFCLQRCTARQVFIPPKVGAIGFPGLSLWIATKHQRRGALVLLQSFPRDDITRFEGIGMSHFSALAYLVVQISQELTDTPIMNEEVDAYIRKCQQVGHHYIWPESPDLFLRSLDGPVYFKQMAKTPPLKLFERLGCTIGMPRRIKTLYRNRFVSNAGLGVFGYPIFVAEDEAEPEGLFHIGRRRK